MALQAQNDLMLIAKISAINILINQLTGENAPVVYNEDYAEINFTEKQKRILQEYIRARLTSTEKTNLRINFLPVVLPPLAQVYGKFIIGAMVIAFLLGRSMGKKAINK